MAAAQVSLDMSTVQARAATLAELQDELDRLTSVVADVSAQQDAARWTTIPSCQAFARSYAATLRELEGHLHRLRRAVLDLRLDLRASARALVETDREAEALLTAVGAGLDAADAPTSPETPTGPTAPTGPGAPADPFAPTGPVGPSAPADPYAPGA